MTERPNSIRGVSLRNYLDSTKDFHDGYGFKEFSRMRSLPIPPSMNSMARIYGVSRHTMKKWIVIYHEEHVQSSL